MTSFEDQYLDVLHNIESGILMVYRQRPELADFDVENALNDLIRQYSAEMKGRSAGPARLNPLAQAVCDSVRVMCEWRLGRGQIGTSEDGESLPQPPPIRIDEIIACLKRIRKSVQFWNREGGRRGYLTFVQEYVP